MARAQTGEKIYWVLLPTPVAVISVLLLITFVILAIVALAFATNDLDKESSSYYILAGASFVSVFCAMFTAFSTALTVRSAKKLKRDKWYRDAETRRQSSSAGLKEAEQATTEDEEEEQEIEDEKEQEDDAQVAITVNLISGQRVKEFQTAPIRNFTPDAVFALYLCYQFIFLTALSVLWTIAIANNNTSVQTSPWPFLFCQLLTAILGPTFLVVAGVCGGVVLKFITKGSIDTSQLITALLPGVALEHSQTASYWVIADTFYYKIDPPKFEPETKQYKFRHAWDRTLSTWCLTTIIAASLIIAVSYFANESIAEVRTVDTCVLLGPQMEQYSCFTQLGFDFVNCSKRTDEKNIHCFRFQEFVNDADPIGSLLEAVVLYLVTVEIFKLIFKGVRILLRFKPSKVWGWVILVIGFVCLSIALLVLGFSYGFGFDLALVRQLQLVLVGVAITVTGVLLVRGKWWEKVPEASETIELRSLEGMQRVKSPPISPNAGTGTSSDVKLSTSQEADDKEDTKRDEVVVEVQPDGNEMAASTAL